jgi:hypothetical protein
MFPFLALLKKIGLTQNACTQEKGDNAYWKGVGMRRKAAHNQGSK